MTKIKRLLEVYEEFITIPWRHDTDPEQRILFCVYDEQDELRMRVKIDEFELITRQADHDWIRFDITDFLPRWVVQQRYAASYFKDANTMRTAMPRFLQFIVKEFTTFLETTPYDTDTVAAVSGVGSLYGFLRVKEVVDALAPLFPGKLLVFFPGRYENNNYRLLDGYDGWSYRAVPLLDTM